MFYLVDIGIGSPGGESIYRMKGKAVEKCHMTKENIPGGILLKKLVCLKF